MSIKFSISIDDDLAKLVKKEASRTGRNISEIFTEAIKAYRKELARKSYAEIGKINEEIEIFEDAQLESLEGLI